MSKEQAVHVCCGRKCAEQNTRTKQKWKVLYNDKPYIETGHIGQTEETKFSLQEFWQGNFLEKQPFERARHI
jgi:hypothetical protein